jgi:hypothetical protein
MADLEIEVIGNEVASATVSTTSSLDLTIELSTASTTGAAVSTEVVEVTFPGPTVIGPGMIENRGNTPGIMTLDAGAPVPAGTPAGTVILRKS